MVWTSHNPRATTFNYSLNKLFIISSNKTALIYVEKHLHKSLQIRAN